jgi:hypothetical protein
MRCAHGFRGPVPKASGGAHATFNASSASQLRDLLKAVALFAAGGVKALEGRKDAASVLLLEQYRKE